MGGFQGYYRTPYSEFVTFSSEIVHYYFDRWEAAAPNKYPLGEKGGTINRASFARSNVMDTTGCMKLCSMDPKLLAFAVDSGSDDSFCWCYTEDSSLDMYNNANTESGELSI